MSGNGDFRVLIFHIFPDAVPTLMVQASLNMGWAILNAAGLSFIGLGVSRQRRNGAFWSQTAPATSSPESGGCSSFRDLL